MNPFEVNKMWLHADRIAEWQKGGLPPPTTCELDLTNLCNHTCPGCTFSYLVNVDKSQIPFDRAQRIVREIAEFGARAVIFSGGGEPLVYGEAKVLALAELAKSSGLDVGLITNGSLLRSKRWLDVCSWVRVSLDAYDEDTFARFHGRNDKEFRKVCSNLADFCSSGGPATVGAGFLVDGGSVERDDFWRMAEFCAYMFPGLSYLQFRPLVTNMVADPSLSGGSLPDWSAALPLLRKAQEAYSRPDFSVVASEAKFDALKEERKYSRCLAHFLEAVVSADSKVYICCHTQGQEKFCFGDLSESSFADVWCSDRAKEVYDSFDPRVTCPLACRMHNQNAALQALESAPHPNFV